LLSPTSRSLILLNWRWLPPSWCSFSFVRLLHSGSLTRTMASTRTAAVSRRWPVNVSFSSGIFGLLNLRNPLRCKIINGPLCTANNRDLVGHVLIARIMMSCSLKVYKIEYGNFETRQVRTPGSNSRKRSGLRIIAAMAVSTAGTNLSAALS
jgi:hypothetical protein